MAMLPGCLEVVYEQFAAHTPIGDVCSHPHGRTFTPIVSVDPVPYAHRFCDRSQLTPGSISAPSQLPSSSTEVAQCSMAKSVLIHVHNPLYQSGK